MAKMGAYYGYRAVFDSTHARNEEMVLEMARQGFAAAERIEGVKFSEPIWHDVYPIDDETSALQAYARVEVPTVGPV